MNSPLSPHLLLSQKDKMPTTVYVSGCEATHDNLLVKTTHEEIENLVEEYTKNGEARDHFPKIWANIKNIDTDKLWADGTKQQLADFNNDIVLFYVCRFVLFKKSIPLAKNELVNENILIKPGKNTMFTAV